MQSQPSTEDNRIRSLENWLPLVQAENIRHGWELNAAELEQLVHNTSAALDLTVSELGARAVLWHYHRVLLEERT
jgi:hypothetical protein